MKFIRWKTFCVVQPYSGTLNSILINWICTSQNPENPSNTHFKQVSISFQYIIKSIYIYSLQFNQSLGNEKIQNHNTHSEDIRTQLKVNPPINYCCNYLFINLISPIKMSQSHKPKSQWFITMKMQQARQTFIIIITVSQSIIIIPKIHKEPEHKIESQNKNKRERERELGPKRWRRQGHKQHRECRRSRLATERTHWHRPTNQPAELPCPPWTWSSVAFSSFLIALQLAS